MKPTCDLSHTDGNVFSLMGAVSSCLKKAGLKDQSEKMLSEVMNCGSYDEALSIFTQYVEIEL